MHPLAARRVLVALVALGLGLSGCSRPSYRRDSVGEAIHHIATTEYQLNVSVRQTDRAIAVRLHHPGMLQQLGAQVGLSPASLQTLGNLLESIHRVLLSTDRPLDFYVVLLSDPATPGAYLTLVRYLEDVRRVNSVNISPTEFFARTIVEVKIEGDPEAEFNQIPLTDFTLEGFLSWQLAQRIRTRLADRVTVAGVPTAQVGPCVGDFRNGEFTFALNVSPQPGAPPDEALIQQLFEDATTVIAQVLADYRFDRFESIRLIHPFTGRNLLLPKAQLELFR